MSVGQTVDIMTGDVEYNGGADGRCCRLSTGAENKNGLMSALISVKEVIYGRKFTR